MKYVVTILDKNKIFLNSVLHFIKMYGLCREKIKRRTKEYGK